MTSTKTGTQRTTSVHEPRGRRAHVQDRVRSGADRGVLRAVLAPVGVGLTIGLIFVSVYLAAFHSPTPHHLPIAAVGANQSVRSLSRGFDRHLPGGFTVMRASNVTAARIAVEHRRAFGAVIVSGDRATLLYAGANGPAVASVLSAAVGGAARFAGISLTQRDILPAVRGDTRGLSIFYAAFGLVLAGFLFGSVTFQAAPRLRLRHRLLSLAIFAVAGGVLITLIAKAFGAMPGPFVGLAGVIALMAAAAGGASMTFVRLLGGAGVSLGSVVLLVLGNSTSGGSLPPDFLPGWLHPLSRVLPVGVGVRALNGLAYFHNDGLITAAAVLSGWVVACVAVLVIRDELGARHAPRAVTVARLRSVASDPPSGDVAPPRRLSDQSLIRSDNEPGDKLVTHHPDLTPNLWNPVNLGAIRLPHRIAMAPMTRDRSTPAGVPTELNAEYYAQRASTALIITEGTQPSDDGQGYLLTPGIYTEEHIAGWRAVTDAVHAAGGQIVIQLMHVGRISHMANTAHGRQPVAPSAIRPAGTMFTASGMQELPEPRALSTDEVAETIRDFRHAAAAAVEAGADGVEIHGANGYLVHQFLSSNANQRTDRYGGSIENRIRFAVEVATEVAQEIGAERTGIRISPGGRFNDIVEEDVSELYGELVPALGELDLAYLHLMHTGDDGLSWAIRRAWPGALILNRGGADLAARARDLKGGLADVVSVGSMALANPDLVARIKDGAPLNQPDPSTFYGGDAHGYTDYPTLADTDLANAA